MSGRVHEKSALRGIGGWEAPMAVAKTCRSLDSAAGAAVHGEPLRAGLRHPRRVSRDFLDSNSVCFGVLFMAKFGPMLPVGYVATRRANGWLRKWLAGRTEPWSRETDALRVSFTGCVGSAVPPQTVVTRNATGAEPPLRVTGTHGALAGSALRVTPSPPVHGTRCSKSRPEAHRHPHAPSPSNAPWQ
jgi:hypothetical protein